MYYYFFQKDLDALKAKIELLRQLIKGIGKEMGASCQEGAETYHDNFAYEQGARDMSMWSEELRKLLHILDKARVISEEPNTQRVAIGRTVTLLNEATGLTEKFKIGSYMIFDQDSVNKNGSEVKKISYCSPIAQLIMLAEVGEKREGNIAGKSKSFIIKDIE